MWGITAEGSLHMAASPATRQKFGAAMKRRRKAKEPPMPLRVLVKQMIEAGDDLTEATLSGYERGEYAPSRDRAYLIDNLLGGKGELVTILGYAGDTEHMVTVQDLDARLKRIEEMVGQLVSDELGAAEADPRDGPSSRPSQRA